MSIRTKAKDLEGKYTPYVFPPLFIKPPYINVFLMIKVLICQEDSSPLHAWLSLCSSLVGGLATGLSLPSLHVYVAEVFTGRRSDIVTFIIYTNKTSTQQLQKQIKTDQWLNPSFCFYYFITTANRNSAPDFFYPSQVLILSFRV